MAHIEMRHQTGGPWQFVINGVDFTDEIYRGNLEIVEVGDVPEYAEVGLRVTFVVSRLDLDGEADIPITDRVRSVATRVHSMAEEAD